jgi:hypothetical protein
VGRQPDVAAALVAEPSLRTPVGRERLDAFLQNKGPWLRLDHDRPFLPDVPAKPEAGSFYPPGATKPQIEKWQASLPAPARAAAQGFFTTIRRVPDGNYTVVPYALEYLGQGPARGAGRGGS